MPHTVISTTPHYPGTVTLVSPLTFPQYFAWREANEAAQEYSKPGEAAGTVDITDIERYSAAMLSGVLALVESHTIANLPTPLTPENFPATPLLPGLMFIRWLAGEVSAMVWSENAVPKG